MSKSKVMYKYKLCSAYEYFCISISSVVPKGTSVQV